MTQKIEVIFDGKVLKPCTPIKLKKNEHYRVLIEIEDKKESQEENPFLRYIHTPVNHGGLAQNIDEELYGR